MKLLLRLSLLMFVFASCKPSAPSIADPLAGTVRHELEGTTASMQLPPSFKRSSRYRLSDDIPNLKSDPSLLYALQNTLEAIEYEDEALDVFIDTSSFFRVLILVDFEAIDFTERQAQMFYSQLQAFYRQFESQNKGSTAEKVSAGLKNNGNTKVFKAKHIIQDKLSMYYRNVYFLTTDRRSIIAFEININADDAEKYMWSIKN